MDLNQFTTTELDAMIIALTEVLCTQAQPIQHETADDSLKRMACESAREKLEAHVQERLG